MIDSSLHRLVMTKKILNPNATEGEGGGWGKINFPSIVLHGFYVQTHLFEIRK